MGDRIRELLTGSARRGFDRWRGRERSHEREQRDWDAGLWGLVEELGLPRCLAPERHGGSGVALADALAVVRLAGEYALPVPLAEAILAHHMTALAGLEAPEGPITMAPPHTTGEVRASRSADRVVLDGMARRVPWGGMAAAALVAARVDGTAVLAMVGRGDCEVRPGANLAGEPRDTLVFSATVARQHASAPIDPDALLQWGAAFRVTQMAGACETVVRLTLDYANLREQFGRPIAKFQVIQQYLALLASQAAICTGAADLAARALEGGNPELGVACAKARAGEAGATAASLAHQVFGAIGFSREHELHRTTQRLLAWREEFGSDAYWARRVGDLAFDAGADRLWPLLAA